MRVKSLAKKNTPTRRIHAVLDSPARSCLDMTVAFDAAKASSGWTSSPDPFTFNHTPVGTPRGVLVLIGGANSADLITGVTYGGVTMTRTPNGRAVDSVGEALSTYAYFLGSGVPTGTQTVSVDHTASGHAKIAFCITFTAGDDTEIVIDNILQGDQADPQISLDTNTRVSLRCFVVGSGHNAPSSLTLISGMTSVGSGTDGAKSIVCGRETSPSSGNTTVGWTATSEDVAMVAVSVAEKLPLLYINKKAPSLNQAVQRANL